VAAPLLEPESSAGWRSPSAPGAPSASLNEATVEGQALGPVGPGAVASDARRPKKREIAFWMAVAWLVVVGLSAALADVLPVADPLLPNVADNLATPGSEHVLGTDGLGRDTLARLVHGARVSAVVSLTAVGVGMLVGGTLGTVAGFVRGWFDTALMTVINIMLAFPALVLLLALLAYVGQGLAVISLVIGFLSIPIYTRVARANTLAIAQRDFVLAARAVGASRARVIWREVAPNVVMPVAAFALVAMGVVIVLEGTLSFLGLSVEPPTPTWGSMIAEGKRHLSEAPHVALIPSAVMFLTVLSLNYVGDTLRRRFDVRGANL
jgi:peptide/nickel transport system permease protein